MFTLSPLPGRLLERQVMRAVFKKAHLLLNLGQLEDENTLNSMQI